MKKELTLIYRMDASKESSPVLSNFLYQSHQLKETEKFFNFDKSINYDAFFSKNKTINSN